MIIGGTQTGSYQTGSYQKGRVIPPRPKSLHLLLFFDTTPFICLWCQVRDIPRSSSSQSRSWYCLSQCCTRRDRALTDAFGYACMCTFVPVMIVVHSSSGGGGGGGSSIVTIISIMIISIFDASLRVHVWGTRVRRGRRTAWPSRQKRPKWRHGRFG